MKNKQRTFMMIFGAFAIFFTGFPHIFSVYVPYMMEVTGWSGEQTSMCFYFAFLSFVFGNVIGGRRQNQSGTRRILCIGGILQALGVLLTSVLLKSQFLHPGMLYLTYGVIQGFGQGMIYAVVLSVAQKWFPEKTGFATGIIVTANGLCGFFLAPFSRMLLECGGVQLAFLVIGGMMGAACLLSVLFVTEPNPVTEYGSNGVTVYFKHQYTSKEMLKTPKFYFLVATMMFSLISYFMISPISQTLQTERGISAKIAVAAVMCGSIVNALARLLIPSLGDKVGRAGCIKVVTILSAITMFTLAISRSYLTTMGIILIYGCYGGIMGSFPSFTSGIFGMEHSGENYGYVMSGMVIATLGTPMIVRLITGMGYQIEVAFVIGTICALLALLSVTLLEVRLEEEKNEVHKV